MKAFCPNHAQLLLVGVQYLLSPWCDWQCCPHIRYLHVPALYLAIVHPTPRPSSIADEFAKSPSFLVCIDDQCNSKPFVPDTAAFARQHYFIIFSKSTCQSHSKCTSWEKSKIIPYCRLKNVLWLRQPTHVNSYIYNAVQHILLRLVVIRMQYAGSHCHNGGRRLYCFYTCSLTIETP